MKPNKVDITLGLTSATICLLASEVFLQLLYRGNLTSSAWPIFSHLEGVSHSPLNRPNINQQHSYREMYKNAAQYSPISFRTDSVGLIRPTSLDDNPYTGPKILVCGGSTSESSAIPENIRPAAVLQSLIKQPVLNASRSGNSISDCIKVAKHVSNYIDLNDINAFILATNVNTMGAFLSSRAQPDSPSLMGESRWISLRRLLLEKTLPGTYTLYRNIVRSSKFNSVEPGASHPAEQALLKGCCHIASTINRGKNSSTIDYDDPALYADYTTYLRKNFESLNKRISSRTVKYALIEPNSYAFAVLPGLSQLYRQYLYNQDGTQMTQADSLEIQAKFDVLYAQAAKIAGFKIISFQNSRVTSASYLRPEDFVDTVHLTPSGAKKVGNVLYAELSPN